MKALQAIFGQDLICRMRIRLQAHKAFQRFLNVHFSNPRNCTFWTIRAISSLRDIFPTHLKHFYRRLQKFYLSEKSHKLPHRLIHFYFLGFLGAKLIFSAFPCPFSQNRTIECRENHLLIRNINLNPKDPPPLYLSPTAYMPSTYLYIQPYYYTS